MPKLHPPKTLKYRIKDLLYRQYGLSWMDGMNDLSKAMGKHLRTLNRFMNTQIDSEMKIPLEDQFVMIEFFKLKNLDDLLTQADEQHSEKKLAKMK